MRKSIEATNAACNAVVQLVNDGSSFSSGGIYLKNEDYTAVTRLPLSVPAFGDSTDGTSVAHEIFDATAYMDATIAFYEVRNRDDAYVWDGTGSTFSGSGDFKLPTLIIYQDSTVAVSSGFYAVPR